MVDRAIGVCNASEIIFQAVEQPDGAKVALAPCAPQLRHSAKKTKKTLGLSRFSTPNQNFGFD